MDYEDFLQEFVGEIEKRVSDHIGMKCSVNLEQVTKINRSFDAVQIRPEGSNIAPVVYLESFYEEACQGQPMESLIAEALDAIQKSIRDVPAIDLSGIKDYEQIQDHLSVELISAKRNAQMLKGVPHTMIEDMAAIYRIHQEFGNGMSGTILLSNDLFANYDVTMEKLHADAIHSAAILRPACITGMSHVLYEEYQLGVLGINGKPRSAQDEFMFVATVSDNERGAGVLLYENFLEDAAKLLGGDFFVMPASRHEVVLVRKDVDVSLEELKDLIKVSNMLQMPREEQLTDSIYHYDSKNHIFELADKFEARQKQELGAAKTSVLKGLKEKQVEVDIRVAGPKESVQKSRGGEVL